jgi:hypothetical protein
MSGDMSLPVQANRSTPQWREAVAAAVATLLSLVIVFGAVALATTSMAVRLGAGIIAPSCLAMIFGVFALVKRNRRRGVGVFVGLTVATCITLFSWWVMLISSGIS